MNHNNKKIALRDIFNNGVHGGTRTPDRALRRRMLYPAELRGQTALLY